MTEPLRLYTFSISHFSEKIRWTLAHERIAFVEVPWTPALHIGAARRRGPATTVPILEADGVQLQDSTAILEWLDANIGPLSLLPRDASERSEVMAIEARFDAVGTDVIRLAYDHLFPKSAAVVRLWTIDATPMQALAVRVGFPVFRTLLRRRIGMDPSRIAGSRESIESAMAFIEARVATGAQHLVSDRLTIADVTAAALLAPLVCPDEHPVYGSDRYRAEMEPLVAPWNARPAFAWVRRMFRDHRGEWPRAAAIREVLARA